MCKSFTRPVLTTLLMSLAAFPAAAQELLITDVRLVDPETKEIRRGHLRIAEGRIVALETTVPKGYDGPRIDAGGRWAIPGLHDLHTHTFGNAAPGNQIEMLGTPAVARRMLFCGVSAFLDLFGLEPVILGVRDRQRKEGFEAMPGAAIFAAGPCITATEGHCTEYGIPTRVIDTPDDARREIGELAEKKPDVIKVVYDHQSYGQRSMPTIDRATLEAAIATARAHDLPTVIHVGTWDDVRDAVRAGATAVTHVPRGPIPDGLAAKMAERGVYAIPTLAVHAELSALVADPELLDDPLLRAVTTEPMRDAYRDAEAFGERGKVWLKFQGEHREERFRSVGALADAGVRILTGTDAGNFGVFQGWSVHRELEHLVAAGLDPWRALAASTTDAGAFLGRDVGFSAGDEATLVLLDASPIENVRNTRKIHRVVQHGRVVDRDALLPPATAP